MSSGLLVSNTTTSLRGEPSNVRLVLWKEWDPDVFRLGRRAFLAVLTTDEACATLRDSDISPVLSGENELRTRIEKTCLGWKTSYAGIKT